MGQSRVTVGRTPPTWSLSCLSAFSSLAPAGSPFKKKNKQNKTGLEAILREVRTGSSGGADIYSQAGETGAQGAWRVEGVTEKGEQDESGAPTREGRGGWEGLG